MNNDLLNRVDDLLSGHSFALLIGLPVLFIAMVFITNGLIEKEYRKTHPLYGSGYTAMKFYLDLLLKWCKRSMGSLCIAILLLIGVEMYLLIHQLGTGMNIRVVFFMGAAFIQFFVPLFPVALWSGYFISLIDFLRKKNRFFSTD